MKSYNYGGTLVGSWCRLFEICLQNMYKAQH